VSFRKIARSALSLFCALLIVHAVFVFFSMEFWIHRIATNPEKVDVMLSLLSDHVNFNVVSSIVVSVALVIVLSRQNDRSNETRGDKQ
jgi:hypothetical protein